jgi:hypothetical protein
MFTAIVAMMHNRHTTMTSKPYVRQALVSVLHNQAPTLLPVPLAFTSDLLAKRAVCFLLPFRFLLLATLPPAAASALSAVVLAVAVPAIIMFGNAWLTSKRMMCCTSTVSEAQVRYYGRNNFYTRVAVCSDCALAC